jgi:hypothetical protein
MTPEAADLKTRVAQEVVGLLGQRGTSCDLVEIGLHILSYPIPSSRSLRVMGDCVSER